MGKGPFKLRSGNNTSFKEMGSDTPLEWHKPGHEKGLFQSIHGALTGTEGKKFGETEVGKNLAQTGADLKQTAENIKTNINLDRPLFGDQSGQMPITTSDKTKIDQMESAEELTDTTPSHTLSEAEMGATNLHKFYKAGGKTLPSVGDRRSLYEAHGGEGSYVGSKDQNIFLLDKLKGGGESPAKHRGDGNHPIHHGPNYGYTKTLTAKKSGTKTWGKKLYLQGEMTKMGRPSGDPNWSEKASELHGKIKNLEEQGKTVETSRKLRGLQNKLNKELGSDVRHKKNIFTGEYKKKTK